MKAFVLIEDNEKNGSVNVTCLFDPPYRRIEKEGSITITSHYLAVKAAEYIKAICLGYEKECLVFDGIINDPNQQKSIN